MNQFFLLIFLSLFTMTHSHTNTSPCSGDDVSLNQFRWENRIVVMFARSSDSALYKHQVNKFSSHKDGFYDRDLILISIFDKECATLDEEIISDSSANDIRSKLSPPNDVYSIFLIGKDGGIKLKQNEYLGPEELFRVIDRMPMRMREMKNDG